MTKNITKRTVAGVLSVLCAAGVVTANASFGGLVADTAITASAETYEDYEYRLLDDGTVEITDYYGKKKEITIPAEIDGKAVSSLDLLFLLYTEVSSITVDSNNAYLSSYDGAVYNKDKTVLIKCPIEKTSIEIPNTVTSISDDAIRFCNNLTSITIPDSVINIGERAFYKCSGLTSITIPDSVTNIGHLCFNSCSSLMSIDVSRNNSYFYSYDGLLYDRKNKMLIQCPCARENVKIANGTVSFGYGAFENCSNLTNITIPDTVTEIGENAFWNCSNLTRITIPCGVTNFGDYAFANCSNLTSINIQHGVSSIGNNAFTNCINLANITIPDSVTSIGEYAFRNCKYLTSITIPNSVTSIGEDAFIYCKNLTSITLSNSITGISKGTFMCCESLTSITIPDSVKSICNGAFSWCESLTSVTIPNNVTSIGKTAFGMCRSLSDVYYSGTEDEWNTINISDENEPLTNATIHFNYKLNQNPTVTFEKGNNAVKLKWNKVDGAEKYGIAGYIGGKWKLLDVGPAKASSYVLKNLTAGRNYKVAVVAMFDGKWNMDFSKAITVTPNAPVYPDVKSEVKGGYCRLTWEPVENAEGYAVAFYDNGWKVLKTLSADTLTYTSTKLATGTYHAAVCVKLNGKWVTNSIKSHALTITIK